MRAFFLSSKIDGAVVTAKRLHYRGSITVAADVMEAAGLEPFQQVQVLNLNNGERFETYTIRGRRGSGAVELNGPAARLGEVGDSVTILSYCVPDPGEAVSPRIVHLGPGNRPVRRARRRAGRGR